MDPGGTRVVEQNFQFDLVSTDKLLRKFIDREITVEQTRGDKVDKFDRHAAVDGRRDGVARGRRLVRGIAQLRDYAA